MACQSGRNCPGDDRLLKGAILLARVVVGGVALIAIFWRIRICRERSKQLVATEKLLETPEGAPLGPPPFLVYGEPRPYESSTALSDPRGMEPPPYDGSTVLSMAPPGFPPGLEPRPPPYPPEFDN
jgi:hypothetical protein